MIDNTNIKTFFKTYTQFALALGEGSLTAAIKSKAHRIWKGLQDPTRDEIHVLYKTTNGELDANLIFGLTDIAKSNTKKPPAIKKLNNK